MWIAYDACKILFTTWLGRKDLSTSTSQSFLRRVVQANRLIPLPKDELVALTKEKLEALKKSKTLVTSKHVDNAEREIEVSRVVANVLGLAAVTAVNIPQGASLLQISLP